MNTVVDIANEPRHLGDAATSLARMAGMVGLVGLGASVVIAVATDWEPFFRSYLVNYCYFLSLSLGALFFVLLQHLTRSGWSVVVRRVAETIGGALPLMALLFIPILVTVLVGYEKLYPWSDPPADDALLAEKRAFLNPPFFAVRCVIYFGVWIWLAGYCFKRSVEQDASGDPHLTTRMQRLSAPGMILFAFTITFAAFDFLMSLNPHWFSTIFGVYYFAGATVGFFALLALTMVLLQRSGRLTKVITTEHFHDVGKLVFAFVVFWAYIAYCQYMLIWYANMPEETIWYAARQAGPWAVVTLALLFGHFFVPFLGLISRFPKRRTGLLACGAVWVLLMHWLDLLWLVKPGAHGAGAEQFPLHLLDLTSFVGIGGLFVAAVVRKMGSCSLIPERDPRLGESLGFENF